MSRFFEQIEWQVDPAVLPDDGESVIVCAGDDVGEGFHEDGAWFWASGGSVVGDVICCAMPEGRRA